MALFIGALKNKFRLVLQEKIVSDLQSNGIKGTFMKCRMMNAEVFEIAQELLNSAFCIRHSAFDPCKIEDRVMASRHDLKRNILLRTTL